MRSPFTIQSRDESDNTLAAGLLRARIPFVFNGSAASAKLPDWVGFTAYVNTSDRGQVQELCHLLRACAASASDGKGTIYPNDGPAMPERGDVGKLAAALEALNTAHDALDASASAETMRKARAAVRAAVHTLRA